MSAAHFLVAFPSRMSSIICKPLFPFNSFDFRSSLIFFLLAFKSFFTRWEVLSFSRICTKTQLALDFRQWSMLSPTIREASFLVNEKSFSSAFSCSTLTKSLSILCTSGWPIKISPSSFFTTYL